MAADATNPLLATGKPSDSLSVKLHPLVLLTISDFITRHTLRGQQGPIIGAIIGQQNGREVSMEYAFECNVKAGDALEGQERVVMDEAFFAIRLEQFKDVHKAPALDLVAIFTLGSPQGPQPQHIPMLQQLQQHYHDDILLALFHPEVVLEGKLTGGQLPFSLYQSYYEPGSENADKGLQVDGWGMGRQLQMRFKELSFEVDSGEAEMIGVDFVAKGGGNASAITGNEPQSPTHAAKTQAKGKGKVLAEESNSEAKETPLSSEDDELIASLTGKANAVKMLHSRISLIQSYLTSLPPSYLTDASLSAASTDETATLNHPLLRNIHSLLSRLPLLEPAPATQTTSLPTASAAEISDVHLTSLLSTLTRTIAEARDFGGRHSIVSRAKQDRKAAAMVRGDPGQDGFGGTRRGFGGAEDLFTPESMG